MTWELFLKGLINGLAVGSSFALIALGYSMVYGIAKMINFAHSEFITIGAFIAYAIAKLLHDYAHMEYNVLMLALSVLCAVVVCVLVAFLTERLAYRPLRKKGSSRITALITAIGVSYILFGVLNVINSKQMTFPTFFDDKTKLINTSFIISLVSTAILLVLLTLFVKKTKAGIAMRAVSENEDAAKIVGINNNVIIALTFVIGAGLAGVGVVIYLLRTPYFNVELGSITIGLYPFVAAVVGGIGSLPGAVIGGFLIGIIQEIVNVIVGSNGTPILTKWAPAIIYGIFVIILLVKPSGIMGTDKGEKV